MSASSSGRKVSSAARQAAATEHRIVVQLAGRLGNQMFQYAAGRALADTLGARFVLIGRPVDCKNGPASALDPFELRDLELVAPPIVENRWRRRLQRATDRWLPAHSRRLGLPVIREGDIRSPEAFFDITGSCCLIGFWESPRYFEPAAHRIRSDFDLDRFATGDDTKTKAIPSGPASVAVHVRLGDLTDETRRDGTFDYCRRDYYDRARAILDRADGDLRYVVFSDEPPKARDMLAHWTDCTFVEGNSAYRDIMLMSRCRHFIIANSTFGWWGAWLGAGADSMVVAPRLWLTLNRHRPHRPADPYPAAWIVV